MAVSSSTSNFSKFARLARRGVLFVAILFLLDQGLGHLVSYFFSHTLYGESWPKENWLLSQQYDVVILGSSRAFRHYVPSIIAEKTGLSVFNAGANGQYLLYTYALEQLLLEKYRPKIILVDILPSFIVRAQNPKAEYERLLTLAPYSDNLQIRQLLSQNNPFESVKQWSWLYRYNSRLLSIVANYRNNPGDFDNGYVSVGQPRFRQVNKFDVDTMPDSTIHIDEFKMELLSQLVLKAKENNIQVIAGFSPALEPLSPRCFELLAIYKRLFRDLKVPFIVVLSEDYPEFKDPAKYMDYIHMNAEGANRFTQIFADQLVKILSENHPARSDTNSNIMVGQREAANPHYSN